jgi:hypothetical protein
MKLRSSLQWPYDEADLYDFVVLAHQPNTIRQYKAYTALIRSLARVMPLAWRDPLPRSLGGHYGVTRSLCSGLQQLGVRFAYAPNLDHTNARAAIVLNGIKELKAVLAWRRRDGCELLLAPTSWNCFSIRIKSFCHRRSIA